MPLPHTFPPGSLAIRATTSFVKIERKGKSEGVYSRGKKVALPESDPTLDKRHLRKVYMSLYNDYLAFNHLTESDIHQRAAEAGYQVTLYLTSPTVDILLSYQGEEQHLAEEEVRLVRFQSREAVDLYCDALCDRVPYETFEGWFLSVLPRLNKSRSEEEPILWRDWLAANAQLLERSETVDLYQTAEWYLVYKEHVITRFSSGHAFYMRFQHPVKRMQWILDMLGGLLAAQQTVRRLNQLPQENYTDRVEHLALAEWQIRVIENQY